jgi:AAA domain
VDLADPETAAVLPDPALVVLVGPSGSGKSVWAAERYRPDEVVSSDRLRALVGSGEHDLEASAEAFALLDQIVATLDRKLAVFRQHCLQAGRDPAQAEVTVLDIPVIGRDREHAASIVEKLRGGTTAAAFAQRHHAGPADEHIGRYRLLADRGVKTVFVSLPQLTGPEDIGCLAPIAAAFS